MKKLITILLLVCFAMAQSAKGQSVTAYQKIYVWTSANSYTTYMCADKPKLLNTSTDIIWKVGSSEIHLPRTQSVTFTFPINPDDDAIAPIKQDGCVMLNASELKLSDIPAGTPALLYTLDGKLVAKCNTQADGTASFALSGIRRGTYIVRCGSVNFKFQKQ